MTLSSKTCLRATCYGRGCQHGDPPVVVGVASIVAALHLLQKADQLHLIQLELLDEAALFVQVEAQHRQTVALTLLSKGKDVELPVGAGILHHTCVINMQLCPQGLLESL